MNDYFSAAYEIGYKSVKPNLQMKFSALMENMQETSIRHSDSTSYPMKWYAENNKGFLITNWSVTVDKLPSLHDSIRIITAPIMFRGIFAQRYFSVVNNKGDVLATALSAWIYSDLNRRRPVKVPLELGESFGKLYTLDAEPDFSFPSTNSYTKIDEDMFKATRRDIDSNMHINNVAYIIWAENYIPRNVYLEKNIHEMSTQYKKECMEGQQVVAETWASQDGERYITVFKDSDKLGVLAEIHTVWR